MAEFIIQQESRTMDYYYVDADSPEEAMKKHFEGDSYCEDSEWIDTIGGPEVVSRDGDDYRVPLHVIASCRYEDGSVVLSEAEIIPRAPLVKIPPPPLKREGWWFGIWMP